MSNIPYNRDVELKTAHARIRELEAALLWAKKNIEYEQGKDPMSWHWPNCFGPPQALTALETEGKE